MAEIIVRVCSVCGRRSLWTLASADGTAICRWCARARDIEEGKPPAQWTRLPT